MVVIEQVSFQIGGGIEGHRGYILVTCEVVCTVLVVEIVSTPLKVACRGLHRMLRDVHDVALAWLPSG